MFKNYVVRLTTELAKEVPPSGAGASDAERMRTELDSQSEGLQVLIFIGNKIESGDAVHLTN